MTSPAPEPVEPRNIVVDDCWNRIGVHGDGSCPELRRYIHCRNCPVHAAAAATLLDRTISAEYLSEWARHVAHKRPESQAMTPPLIVFRTGPEWLALPLSVLQEVIERGSIHVLPHRLTSLVLGVTNVRGELLICISLGRLLGMADSSTAGREPTRTVSRMLVIVRDGERFVLPVDEVRGIERFTMADMHPTPVTISAAATVYTRAIVSGKDGTVGCLDERILFDTVGRGLR